MAIPIGSKQSPTGGIDRDA